MKHYVTLIRKSDFTYLFKFGYLYIDIQGVVEYDGDLKSLTEDNSIKERLFERVNQFEYPFEFLVANIKSDLHNGKLNIEEVFNIFALNAEAKAEIESS